MASPKAEAIAREQAELERAEREDGILKTMRRVEQKLDALLELAQPAVTPEGTDGEKKQAEKKK